MGSEEVCSPLNVMDQTIVMGHELLRARGHAGINVQTQVWLAGRLDVAHLELRLKRLGVRFPMLSSRLERKRGGVCWRSAGGCPLHVVELPVDAEAAVRSHAESLFSLPIDLCDSDPIAFYLLRRPAAGDVLILQWAHALMDGKAGEILLREMERLDSDIGQRPANEVDTDAFRQYLSRTPWHRRISTLCKVALAPVPRRPLQLGTCPGRAWGLGPFRTELRTLDTEATEAINARSRKLLGFVNLTPLLLASAFRALAGAQTAPLDPRTRGFTMIPINLRPADFSGPVVHNFQTYVPVSVSPGDLADRDELCRALSRQLRSDLAAELDVGMCMATTILARFPWLYRRSVRNMWTSMSFVFGYHGATIAGLDTFCGVRVTQLISSLPTAFSPPGLALSVNQHAGRLHLAAVHALPQVSADQAAAFLDRTIQDLA